MVSQNAGRQLIKLQRTAGLLGLAALVLAACQQTEGMPAAPTRADLSAELVRLTTAGPPTGPKGACWQSDVTPLVIETVSEQVMIADARRDDKGVVTRPAAFRTDTHQRIVQERERIWFRSPCPSDLTVDFIASLQRALKARGLYLLPLTGALDAPTQSAVQRYQAQRGLDSPRLSLAAARELGLIATSRDDL